MLKRGDKSGKCVEGWKKVPLPKLVRRLSTECGRQRTPQYLPCAIKIKSSELKPEARAMEKVFLHTRKWALIVAVCISAIAMIGCLESSFDLASDSRLPRGMAVPPGLTRADVSVTVDYYTLPRVRFTLRDKNGKKLTTVSGKIKSNVLYLK